MTNSLKKPKQNLVGLYKAKEKPTYRLSKDLKSPRSLKRLEKKKRRLRKRDENNKKVVIRPQR